MSTSSKRLPLLIIGVGVLLVIASITVPIVFKNESETTAPIPAQIAGLSLASKATGSAALQEFTRLHGKAFPVTSGAKAVYGRSSQVIIWAAGTTSGEAARQLLEAMRDKIAEGAADNRAPFQPSGVEMIGSTEVYALDGMGQKHFYFQSGKYLIWLAADGEIADQALRQALDFYP
jgi:hypothetical protein